MFLCLFVSFASAFGVITSRTLPRPMWRAFILTYYLKSFVNSGITFKSLTHFELIFIINKCCKIGFQFYFSVHNFPVFQTPVKKTLFLPFEYFWFSCKILHHHIIWGLFWTFEFSFIGLCVYFYTSTILFLII